MKDIVPFINPALLRAHKAIEGRLTTDKLYFRPLLLDLPHGRGACATTFCTVEALNAIEMSIEQSEYAKKRNRMPNKPYYTARQNDVAQLINVLYIGSPDAIRYCGMGYFKWSLEKLELQKNYAINNLKWYIERKRFGNRLEFVSTSRFEPHMILWSKPSIIILDEASQLTRRMCDVIMETAQCLNDRLGRNTIVMVSYNPDIDPFHWLNLERYNLGSDKANYLRVPSTYKTVPREWLGETFFQEAEMLKKANPQAYKNEYLGQTILSHGRKKED